ncbi:MAG: rRNA maturation RNase YbeY [Bacilli bacterium]|nr:rRNA maturation RNase YbeY [Bacilli bacterium]
MDNEIMIFNQTSEDIPELDLVKKVLEFGMKKEKLNNTSFNVIIVDNNYIHELNKNYRDIDRETDVITFALEDEDSVKLPGDMRILGDIYISIDKARSQAIEYGHSFEREICFLAVHGFYHLLGYDHMNEEEEKIMFGKQEEVLSEYGVTR